MKTETLGKEGIRGWIFYDAECPACRRGMEVIGPVFTHRGYEWQPLQSPGVADRLGLSEAALFEEMKLQMSGGRVVGGLDSWIVLFRAVWWLWPLGFLLTLPGFHAWGRACYGWTARNRYCVGGKCGLRRPTHHHRRIPFLDLP